MILADARHLPSVSDKPTCGSLFAGVGGFDLGLERAGFEVKWQVEIDPFCTRVLEKHWPNVRRYSDVRECCGNVLRANDGRCFECGRREWLPWVDVLCGGFPCQDLSSAGKRAGLTGERSGLYRHFLRIIAELRPISVVIENIHHAWRQWVPVVRRALWDLGYASLPLRMRACDFGAWHERARVFIVAHLDASALRLESWRRDWPFWAQSPLFANTDPEGRHGLLSESQGQGEERPCATSDATNIDPARCQDGQGRGEDAGQYRDGSASGDTGRGWWASEPDVVRVVHGVSSRLHGRRMAARIGALGNAVIPQIVEWIGSRLIATLRPQEVA